MTLHFSEHFRVSADALRDHGAFDISVVSDLPMFVDPFLLFNSTNPKYRALHQSILKYLVYLRDRASDTLDPATIASLYQFREVRQNWLGFSVLGNRGSGLGKDFAAALHQSLSSILKNFGKEKITKSSHLEKLCLIKPGVGRDNISDFTTNLIKEFLCDYTSAFARDHLDPQYCDTFAVPRVRFNYSTDSWEPRTYVLPNLEGDYVLLTPVDMLTRDQTWINHSDMIAQFRQIPESLPDDQLRAQVNHYFLQQLSLDPSAEERRQAIERTFRRFPILIDHYIRSKEDGGDKARAISAEWVAKTDRVFVQQLKELMNDLESRTEFFKKPASSYEEALARCKHFKHYIENQDGYRLINNDGRPFSREAEVQLYFGLVWFSSPFDINREPNNGRGPVDFKVSRGAIDKSLIEFKLGSNTKLERNLANQVKIYEDANQTRKSVKVIICYTAADQSRVRAILKRLKLEREESIIVIDARRDNKPSASNA